MALIEMVDPPEGWKFGFPKPAGEKCDEAWFRAQGYPQELIDRGMLRHVSFFYQEIDKESEN